MSAGRANVHDVGIDGDEQLAIGMRVEVRDDSGRIFAATVADHIGSHWHLTIHP